MMTLPPRSIITSAPWVCQSASATRRGSANSYAARWRVGAADDHWVMVTRESASWWALSLVRGDGCVVVFERPPAKLIVIDFVIHSTGIARCHFCTTAQETSLATTLVIARLY